MQGTVTVLGVLCFAVATGAAVIGAVGTDQGGKNVIDVPKQCKPNEQLDANGNCRPVWRQLANDVFDNGSKNVVDVPKQCKPNEQLDANGRCRPVWLALDGDVTTLDGDSKNVIDVPKQCKPNEQLDSNGRCRPVWRLANDDVSEAIAVKAQQFVRCLLQQITDRSIVCRKSPVNTLNVIDVPRNCPAGQLLDANGRCRPIYRGV